MHTTGGFAYCYCHAERGLVLDVTDMPGVVWVACPKGRSTSTRSWGTYDFDKAAAVVAERKADHEKMRKARYDQGGYYRTRT
jgi:hypothetical protein